jgi:hypothetical protein
MVTTGICKTYPLIAPVSGKLICCRINARIPPQGNSLICDINVNGESLWEISQSNRLILPSNCRDASRRVFDINMIYANDHISLDIDQVGSTVAGGDIAVYIIYDQFLPSQKPKQFQGNWYKDGF